MISCCTPQQGIAGAPTANAAHSPQCAWVLGAGLNLSGWARWHWQGATRATGTAHVALVGQTARSAGCVSLNVGMESRFRVEIRAQVHFRRGGADCFKFSVSHSFWTVFSYHCVKVELLASSLSFSVKTTKSKWWAPSTKNAFLANWWCGDDDGGVCLLHHHKGEDQRCTHQSDEQRERVYTWQVCVFNVQPKADMNQKD